MKWKRTGCRTDESGTVIVYSPPCASPLTIEQRRHAGTGFIEFAVVRGPRDLAARQTMQEAKRIAERYIYNRLKEAEA